MPLPSSELKIKEKQGEHGRERKGMVTIIGCTTPCKSRVLPR